MAKPILREGKFPYETTEQALKLLNLGQEQGAYLPKPGELCKKFQFGTKVKIIDPGPYCGQIGITIDPYPVGEPHPIMVPFEHHVRITEGKFTGALVTYIFSKDVELI